MVIPGTVYRVIRPLGKGGMGEVYEVEHGMLGVRRALKVLARHYAGRQDLTERLRVEARGLARLKHPNLVEVYDLGIASDGRIYFAMDLLSGTTLRAILSRRGAIGSELGVRVMGQALDGLHAAHCAGMLHRDIKPENIFVCRDGIVKLLDFGVAKAVDASISARPVTGAGMTVGTPRYMAPEQAEGRGIDARADVYGAGLVLWECLAGRPAFNQADPFALADAKMAQGVPSLAGLVDSSSPPALVRAIHKACERQPKDRYETANAFATDMRASMLQRDSRGSWLPPSSWLPTQSRVSDAPVRDAAKHRQTWRASVIAFMVPVLIATAIAVAIAYRARHGQ